MTHMLTPDWCKPEEGYPLLRIEERQAMGIAHWAIVDKYDQVVCRFDFLDEDDGKSRAVYMVTACNAHEALLKALKAQIQMRDMARPKKLEEAISWRENDELADRWAKEAIALAEVKA